MGGKAKRDATPRLRFQCPFLRPSFAAVPARETALLPLVRCRGLEKDAASEGKREKVDAEKKIAERRQWSGEAKRREQREREKAEKSPSFLSSFLCLSPPCLGASARQQRSRSWGLGAGSCREKRESERRKSEGAALLSDGRWLFLIFSSASGEAATASTTTTSTFFFTHLLSLFASSSSSLTLPQDHLQVSS